MIKSFDCSSCEDGYNLMKGYNCFHCGNDEVNKHKNILCPKCKCDLVKSDLEDYDYLCNNCDENFYNCEVNK